MITDWNMPIPMKTCYSGYSWYPTNMVISKRTFAILALLWVAIVPVVADESSADPDALLTQEKELRVELDILKESYDDLENKLRKLSGDDLQVFRNEQQEMIMSSLDLVYGLVDNLAEQEAAGMEAVPLRKFVTGLMDKFPEVVERAFNKHEKEIGSLQTEKETASASELAIIEEQLLTQERLIDDLYRLSFIHFTEREKIGLVDEELIEKVVDSLKFRTRLIAGRQRKALTERNVLKNRMRASPDDADLAMRFGAKQIALKSGAESLERLIDLLKPLDVQIAPYQALLVESTGDITKGFDLDVVKGMLKKAWQFLVRWIGDSLPDILTKFFLFAVVFYLFHLFAKLVRKAVARGLAYRKVRVSLLLAKMISSTSYNLVLGLGVLIALSQIGVTLAPLLAGLGVAGFVIGFALQDTLGNFAAGMMILLYRPFDERDLVEAAGVRGWVHKMSLVSTTILTLDNQTLIIPNGKIWGDVICNVTHQKRRRVDLMIGAGYDTNVPHVEKILHEIVDGQDLVLEDPAPVIKLHELGDSSVNYVVRAWTQTSDYWAVYWDILRKVKIRFDEEGITIPFPQRDVHHYYPEGKNEDKS